MTATGTEESFWTDAGSRWVQDSDRVELLGGSLGRLAMDRLDLRPGSRVLDVGCGSGATTVELAHRSSPGGMTIGVDVSRTMLAGAGQRTGVPSMALVQADVQHAEFRPASFDRVFSRFGVMFFDDLVEGFTNLRRALTADGRLAFASWDGPEHNEWMTVPASAAAEALGVPVELPPAGQPGPFSLADPDHIAAILKAAGFHEIDVIRWHDHVSIASADAMVFATGAMSHGGIRTALRNAGPGVERRVQRAIAQRLLARRDADSVVHLGRGANIVTASA